LESKLAVAGAKQAAEKFSFVAAPAVAGAKQVAEKLMFCIRARLVLPLGLEKTMG
jgi:hypothetical protein